MSERCCCSDVSIADAEQVNVGWDDASINEKFFTEVFFKAIFECFKNVINSSKDIFKANFETFQHGVKLVLTWLSPR